MSHSLTVFQKMSGTQGLTRTFRKDFGLSHHRLALPENNHRANISSHLVSQKNDSATHPKNKKRSGTFEVQPAGKGTPGFRGKVKNLLKKSTPKQKITNTKRPDHPVSDERESPDDDDDDDDDDDIEIIPSMPSSSQPSPILHSRVLHKGKLKNGATKSSLENILDEYGLQKDGTPKLGRKNLKLPLEGNSDFIRLTIVSPENEYDEEHQITLKKNYDGFGIHLSVGPPPVSVTLVEPGSEALAAGIREGDVIVEVNGRDCRSMEALELSELMELKSLIQHIPSTSSVNTPVITRSKPTVTVTSIDSDVSSDDNDNDDSSEEEDSNISNTRTTKHKLTTEVWNRIKAQGGLGREMETNSESGSLTNELTNIDSNEDIMQTLQNKAEASALTKVELDEKEWRRIKQQQNLIFNTNAPSYMISQSTPTQASKTKDFQEEEQKSEHESKSLAVKKKFFKWPFGILVKSSASPKTTEKNQSTVVQSPSEVTMQVEATPVKQQKNDTERSLAVEAPIMATRSKRTSRQPSRSQSMIVKTSSSDLSDRRNQNMKFGRLSKEAPADIAIVPRTAPLLGVNVGRERRDIGRTRQVRRPTRRHTTKVTNNDHMYQDHSLESEDKTTNSHLVSSDLKKYTSDPSEQAPVNKEDGASQLRKLLSDPGESTEMEIPDKPNLHRRSSASLVEQAVKKRYSASELKEEGEKQTEQDVSYRLRKYTVGSPYAVNMQIGMTAQMVAMAAASKARTKQQESSKESRQVYQQNMVAADTVGTSSMPVHKPVTTAMKPVLPAAKPFDNVSHQLVNKVSEREPARRYEHSVYTKSSHDSEPSWITIAKNKHEKASRKYLSQERQNDSGNLEGSHYQSVLKENILPLSSEKEKSSHLKRSLSSREHIKTQTGEHGFESRALDDSMTRVSTSLLTDSGIVRNKMAVFETKID